MLIAIMDFQNADTLPKLVIQLPFPPPLNMISVPGAWGSLWGSQPRPPRSHPQVSALLGRGCLVPSAVCCSRQLIMPVSKGAVMLKEVLGIFF